MLQQPRTRERVEQEYGQEKWPAMQRRIEALIASEPDIGLARAVSSVARSQWPHDDPFGTRAFTVDGDETQLPPAGGFGAAQFIVQDLIADACGEDTDLIVELGSGFGWHILTAFATGGPREATYVAAEYTQAGREAAQLLASLDDRLRFRAIEFDYHEPRFEGLGHARHAVVFTAHSIEQIPQVRPELFAAIRGLADRVTCLHFEPAGWQVEGHDGHGSSSAYADEHDYNRNLVGALRDEEAAGRVVIEELLPDVFGINPRNSTTVVRWRTP
jgi:hypothetical protein